MSLVGRSQKQRGAPFLQATPTSPSYARRPPRWLRPYGLLGRLIGTTPDWGTALREISARTLVIVSRAANGDGPHVDFLLEKLPNAAKAVLPRGNFSIALEDPEELNAVLGNFLRGFP